MQQAMDESPHPLQHILRPHHVGLLAVFLLVFHPHDSTKLPSRFLLHIHRVLLNEVSEMTQPKSYKDLIYEVEKGLDPAPPEAERLAEALVAIPSHLKTASLFTGFFGDVPALYREQDDETPAPPFEPRSIFGYFCRRCYVSFNKLSFLGVAKLQENFLAWAAGNSQAGYEKSPKDAIRDDTYILRPQFDKEPYAEPEAFAAFERAHANGDSQVAAENLRRFFEQRFSDNNDSEIRQHAMLNLVRMHICIGQFPAARKLLLEAITVARTMSDNVVLQQCMSLLRRIEGHTRSRKEPLNELQSNIAPLEVLNDVGKLLRESQPLSDSWEKVVQALGIYDLSRDFRGGPPNSKDQWAFHAVQSILWRLAGCEQLAIIEDNIVLAFSESGGPDDVRFKSLLNRVTMLARSGDEERAFRTLLHPETWRGLDYSMNQVAYWSGEVWMTMLLLASRRGQLRQAEEYLKPRRPGYFTGWKDYFFTAPEKMNAALVMESSIYRALQCRQANQAISSVDHLLRALWQSEYQGRFRCYRLCIILLADVGLEFGMTVWSRKLVEEVMPQIIAGDDLELRAFACLVLGRCIIACAGKDYQAVRAALPYLKMAEDDYRTLEMHTAVQDVAYITAVAYHSTGMEKERDEASIRHSKSKEQLQHLESLDVNPNWESIWSLTGEICTVLALR